MTVSASFHDSLKLNLFESENPRWLRYKVGVVEKIGDTKIEHIFAPAVERSTGQVYLDCSTLKLRVKFAIYAILQPVVLTLKTVYHLLLPISIPLEIFLAVKSIKSEERTSGKVFKASLIAAGRSVADIVRTPLHAIASTIVGLVAGKLGEHAPHLLYDMRKIAGKIDLSLSRGDKRNFWIIFNCFQPYGNLEEVSKRHADNSCYTLKWVFEEKTMRWKIKETLNIPAGLSEFGRKRIDFLHGNSTIFNDCGKKLGPEVRFVTPWFKRAEKKNALLPLAAA